MRQKTVLHTAETKSQQSNPVLTEKAESASSVPALVVSVRAPNVASGVVSGHSAGGCPGNRTTGSAAVARSLPRSFFPTEKDISTGEWTRACGEERCCSHKIPESSKSSADFLM